MHRHSLTAVAVSFAAVIAPQLAAPLFAQNATRDISQAPTIEVISTTPLPGLGVPRDSVPGNVQTATDADLRDHGGLQLPNFMERSLGSVNINEAQGNPFQPDVNYRGFTASPILGTPPGISVYQDGVRVNEAFGDSVNWDLIPKSAIGDITLIPGSNPVYGLNTLGGALAITTKNGFDYPGFVAEGYGGSFYRRAVDAEYGGNSGKIGYFVTGNYFDDRGWRDYTSSRVRQGFGKLTFRDDKNDINLSFTGANNTLNGGQTVPVSFLDERRRQAYTFPDTFDNQLAFFNLDGKHYLNNENLISGNIYYRSLRTRNFSTNVNDDFDSTNPIGPGNTQGSNVQANVDTEGFGGGLQYSYLANLANRENRLTVGASFDGAHTDFSQYAQEANFAVDRSNIPEGDFALDTQAGMRNAYYGLYVTDTFSALPWLDLTVSGRYNHAEVRIEDQTGTNPALNGSNNFNRFNPAAGATFKLNPSLSAYASYNEGQRIPTPIELTCADPNAPCSLPNEFLADPPLKAVIARTVEAGLRGSVASTTRWRASVFQTTLSDDIAFISASAGSPNTGFFQNVGTTRRRGVELGVDGKIQRFSYSANYTFIDARFRTPYTEHSAANSSADANGDIQVQAGNQVPGIPRNILKLRGEYQFGERFTLGSSMYWATSQYARGDENNQNAAGKVAGYAVFNLDARFKLGAGWELFGEIDNLFNRKYDTLGVLGTNFFNGPGHTFDADATTNEMFLAPGAPFGAWIGIRYTFGRKD